MRNRDDIARDIKMWDTKNITVLRDLIAEFFEPRDRDYLWDAPDPLEYGFRMDELPSAPIPEDIDTSYPVWAVDEHGNALVGPKADSIETLDEIRAV